MTDLEKKLLQEQQNRASADFGTGSFLTRPEDSSIQKASEDFMGFLNNPTAEMMSPEAPVAPMSNVAPIEDYDAMVEQDALDKSLKAASAMSASIPATKAPSMPQIPSSPKIPSTPQEDILAQLKAARAANEAAMGSARAADRSTELGNLIMKSGAMAGQGIVNRAGNTNIKLDPAQVAAKEAELAGISGKGRLDALMQDYGIKKGIEDTAYSRKKDEQARIDRLSERAEDRQFKLDMLKNKADTKAPPVSEFDKALKKSVGTQSADWVLKDRSQIQNDIAKLKEVEAALQASVDGKGENVSGPVIGRLWGQDFVNEKGYELQNTIDQVTQKNLKDILGGQFAQQEGQDLLKRGYDPKKKEAYNLKNVKALREAMEESSLRKDEAVKSLSEGDSTKDFIQNVQGISRPQNSEKQSKTITSKQYSPSRNKTRVTYSDGSTEIIDGKK